MKKTILGLGLLLLGLMLSACSDPHISGNGNVKSKTYDVENFNKIRVGGDFNLNIRSGADAQKVAVTVDSNILSYVDIQVKDQVLVVTPKDNAVLSPTKTLDVQIELPKLESLVIAGFNTAVVNNLVGDSFNLVAGGMSDISLAGDVQKLDIKASGESKIDAKDLITQHAKLKVNGAGLTVVNAQDSLDITLNGRGNIEYYGKPKIHQEVNGSGVIKAAN